MEGSRVISANYSNDSVHTTVSLHEDRIYETDSPDFLQFHCDSKGQVQYQTPKWKIFGHAVTRNEAMLSCHMIILYLIMISYILSITFHNSESSLLDT